MKREFEFNSDSVSTAYIHLSAVGYFYRRNGKASLTETASIKMYMKGLKRKHIATPVTRALAMSKEILRAMRNLLKETPPTLVLWRTIWRAHIEFAFMLRHDDVKRLTRSELTFEENKTGKFIRMKLIGNRCILKNWLAMSLKQLYLGGKTIMSKLNRKNEKLITYTGGESCLYTLTKEYLNFLGPNHKGSLQPRCQAGFPNQPDPVKYIGYTLALSDLRKVSNSNVAIS